MLRHGRAKNNEVLQAGEILVGDPPLTELGREQAVQIGRAAVVKSYSDAAIYSSALERARETARLAFPNATVIADAAFNEIETNLFQAHAYRIPDEVLRSHLYRSADGESIFDLVTRSMTRLGELLAAHDRVVVVTHAGVLNAAYHHFAGVPLPCFPVLHVENACGLELRIEGGKMTKLSFVSA